MFVVAHRIVDPCVFAVRSFLSPHLGPGSFDGGHRAYPLPAVASVSADSTLGPLPEAHNPPVDESVIGEGFVASLQGDQLVLIAMLLQPLLDYELVFEQCLAGLFESKIIRLREERIVRISIIPAGMRVVSNKINGPVAAGLVNFSHHATDAPIIKGHEVRFWADPVKS